jgi:hypothetical protein
MSPHVDYREARLLLSERELCLLVSLGRHRRNGRGIYWLADEWDDLVGLVNREMSDGIGRCNPMPSLNPTRFA